MFSAFHTRGQQTQQLGRQPVFSLAVRVGGSFWRKVERRTVSRELPLRAATSDYRRSPTSSGADRRETAVEDGGGTLA